MTAQEIRVGRRQNTGSYTCGRQRSGEYLSTSKRGGKLIFSTLSSPPFFISEMTYAIWFPHVTGKDETEGALIALFEYPQVRGSDTGIRNPLLWATPIWDAPPASQIIVPLQTALSLHAKRIRQTGNSRSPAILKIPNNPVNPASDNVHKESSTDP